MNTPRPLPPLPADSLREHGDAVRVERIWARLAPALAEQRVAAPAPRRAPWLGAALAGAALFVAGVATGVAVGRQPAAMAVLAAEPRAATEARRVAPAVSAPDHPADEALPPAPEPPPVSVRRGGVRAVPVVSAAAGALPVAPPVVVAAPAVVAAWQRLADEGDYRAARAALDHAGGAEAVLPTATADQLMLLHDVARGTGDTTLAVRVLRSLVERFPGDANAPIALWSLGKLLEKQGDTEGAAAAWAAYRRLSPQGDFAEDALLREIEAAVARGDREGARSLGEQHERDFPYGKRRGEVRAALARLEGSKAGVADPEPELPEEEDTPGAPAAAASAGAAP